MEMVISLVDCFSEQGVLREIVEASEQVKDSIFKASNEDLDAELRSYHLSFLS